MEGVAGSMMSGPVAADARLLGRPLLGTPPGEAPDAESTCGDSPECLAARLAELEAAQLAPHATGMPTAPPVMTAPPWWPSTSSGGASCSSCDTDTPLCGDDFSLLSDAEASLLLDDARDALVYPGGVDAALADWEAAQRQQRWHHRVNNAQQPQQQSSSVSFSACIVAGRVQRGAAAAPGQCNWQWQAFDGDAVGAVLAGTLPAPSCSSGGGLTACFHNSMLAA